MELVPLLVLLAAGIIAVSEGSGYTGRCHYTDLSSHGYRYAERRYSSAVRVYHMSLRRRYSRSSCSYGRSYGISGNKIWVHRGCRGQFYVCYLNDVNECSRYPCGRIHRCINTIGSYYCSCRSGYYLSRNRCYDTNECTRNPCGSTSTAVCRNTAGSYTCSCRPGFYWHSRYRRCYDINECARRPCGSNAVCHNTHGSYRCSCNTGFYMIRGRCYDYNECVRRPCGSYSTCTNTYGSYRCSCHNGFYMRYKNRCYDVNECSRNPCGSYSYCHNTIGSFRCSCRTGFYLYRNRCYDVNECSRRPCGSYATCYNTVGSYYCRCRTGYQMIRGRCYDINECARRPSPCGSFSICTNTAGSYRCSCRTGFVYNSRYRRCYDINECAYSRNYCAIRGMLCVNTLGSYRCTCRSGFTLSRGRCIDINECLRNPCRRSGQQCYNTHGSYYCRCKSGYITMPIIGTCIDINECMTPFKCGFNGRCINLPGSYRCDCKAGYARVGSRCVDINECLRNPCRRSGQICTNTIGSYRCHCKSGYITIPIVGSCIDINECIIPFKCGFNGICHNTAGSYHCSCKRGYQKVRGSCIDVNECASSPCGKNSVCTNTIGSYRCSCRGGFTPYRHGGCIDINECLRRPCPRNNKCTNLQGSYRCSCISGYTRLSVVGICIDINECARRPCGRNTVCTNTPGSYKCTCNRGFTMVRGYCVDVNECTRRGICPTYSRCYNTYGSYYCRCSNGFTMRSGRCYDNNECARAGICGKYSTCSNTIGSYKCACQSGFTRANGACVDINECARNPCGAYSTCQNLLGSYRCGCRSGFYRRGARCYDTNECARRPCGIHKCQNTLGSYKCQCLPGYALKNGKCVDVNECLARPCGIHDCANTAGSFTCNCLRGYAKKSGKCSDVNECAASKNPCGIHQCTNLVGSYKCTCNRGYVKKAGECVDINECSTRPCGIHSCINTPGSYNCKCNSGYTKDRNGKCVDINECSARTNPCGIHSCQNTQGSYVCHCKNGYSKVNNRCYDINECTRGKPCGIHSCENTPGSYQCKCNTGYQKDRNDKCVDTDECAARVNPCGIHKCQNSIGSFSCICNKGYVKNAQKQCVDVNECERKPCGIHNCKNTPGSFQCVCLSGYMIDLKRGGENQCVDINECAASKNPCGIHTCENKPGTFVCHCVSGYRKNNNHQCVDINECSEGACGVHECINNVGSYVCNCKTGFAKEVGQNCIDINECETGKPCGIHECTNSHGSYQCTCNEGYTKNNGKCVDINECKSNAHGCNFTSEECVNHVGSHSCDCKPGYEENKKAGFCTDTNECQRTGKDFPCKYFTGIHICHNTQGSYTCTCKKGYQMVRGDCVDVNECLSQPCGKHDCVNHVGSFECQCLDGYEKNKEGQCVDVNECQVNKKICGIHKCTNNAGSYDCICLSGYKKKNGECVDIDECESDPCGIHECKNTIGSYKCECLEGYSLTSGNTCKDINECADKKTCGIHTCLNTAGSFNCQCNTGYTKLNNECVDVDECSNNACGDHECENSEGSYKCICNEGYKLDASGKCIDINECLNNPCGKHDCANTEGSYKCSCLSGYTLQNNECIDIDECDKEDACGIHECENLEGSFKCVCEEGWRVGADGQCEDVDECAEKPCGDNICINTDGSYTCQCSDGYLKKDNACIDVDECETDPCGIHVCKNSIGSFTCICKAGYKLVDGDCEDIDECAEQKCGVHGCENFDGSYNCTCLEGYDLTDGNCVDRDECENDPCGIHQCKNTDGSYECKCLDGYKTDKDGNCVDIDECAENKCGIHDCENSEGSYECTCNEGFVKTDGKCVDIDECTKDGKNPCGDSPCFNNQGSYTCKCEKGYKDVSGECLDVDECAENGCGDHDCENLDGSYKCTCLDGYEKKAGTQECVDVDECKKDPCGIHKCINLPGSYNCTCNKGYHVENNECFDNDECHHGMHNCNAQTEDCDNTYGGYNCDCKEGFKTDPTGVSKHCIDIDECEIGTAKCNETSSHCVNYFGYYACECNDGYKMDPSQNSTTCFENDEEDEGDEDAEEEAEACKKLNCTTEGENKQYCGLVTDDLKELKGDDLPDYICVDVDYRVGTCSMKHILCHEDANCTESEDNLSIKCMCPDDAEGDGFKNGTGCKLTYKKCINNFDCPDNGHCNGDYKCECNAGFDGDARYNCTDIIDCPSDKCDPHAICRDIPGNFTCTCKQDEGFYGNGYECTYKCHGDQDCHFNGKCNADRECECRSGYQGNGSHCEDLKECADPSLNSCDQNATCIERVGTYDCKCNNGYKGDGYQCERMPMNCDEVNTMMGGMVNGELYTIDPDFEGPANPMEVRCYKSKGGVIYTSLAAKGHPMSVKSTVEIDYDVSEVEIKALLENSAFCKQEMEIQCGSGFAIFPGTSWVDAKGVVHKNFGSKKDNECSCGAVGECDKCMCDGSRSSSDKALFFDKEALPVMKMTFSQGTLHRGTLKKIGALQCASKQFDIPKDCHEAKFDLNIKEDGPLHIDPDGAGGAAPFLAFCNMRSFEHVGITEVKPAVETITGSGDVEYSNGMDQMKALIEGSLFCSQSVEFQCKDSPLMGSAGGYVSGPKQRLDYFPGANGVKDSCACGATNSCEKKEVMCNCNIQDGKERSDFGLIIDKNDLPAVSVTAKHGGQSSGTYKIGGLQCSQKQFGIEPNCEKYRIAHGIKANHTYFIDADGPEGKLAPFPVECRFEENPPISYTIVHHDNEEEIIAGDVEVFFKYLQATPDQIKGLKDRSPSTVCTQEVKIGCNRYNLKYDDKAVTWKTSDGKVVDLAKAMEGCSADGLKCKCDGSAETTDEGYLKDQDQVPATSMNFKATNGQRRSQLSVHLGPLVCTELFPTCAMLKSFMDSNDAAEGEGAVINGKFTIDPDGPGGSAPFQVTCQFPATIIDILPGEGGITPDPSNNSTEPHSECFPITYKDAAGNKISPEQITELVKASDDCSQKLDLECQNAPASGMVNFTSCDGTTQAGWAGSYGEDKCACGVNGNCEGGNYAKCNCDMNDNEVRNDGGNILQTDRLPVCEVCLSASPYPAPVPGQKLPPQKRLKYTLGKLECNSGKGTGGETCQEARKNHGKIDKITEVGISVMKDSPAPVGCRYYPDPPVGEMVIKPDPPVYPPNGTEPVDVPVKYINLNIDLTRDAMQKNEYCSQDVFFFCAKDHVFHLDPPNNYYKDFEGNEYSDWKEMASNDEDVIAACDMYPELCEKCGAPRGFKISKKEILPLAQIKLSISGVTVIIGDTICVDILPSCQHLMDKDSKRYSGHISHNSWIIDPDQSGQIRPFKVKCHMDWKNKDGITEMEAGEGNFDALAPVYVEGQTEPANFSLPIDYESATIQQADSLTAVSNFCWQSVKYDCNLSPIHKDGKKMAFINLLNSGNVTAFGTGEDISFKGCACAQIGTCKNEDVLCNCDIGGQQVDQGSITNKEALPIASVYVGGQAANGKVGVHVNSLRCSGRPVDPPKDCAQAKEWKSKNGIDYSKSGEYLISPDPSKVKPFMVYCDFDTVPGQGLTVIKPEEEKTKINHVPGSKMITEVKYYAPSDEQIRALIDQSEFCSQGVRYECQGSVIFDQGNHWFTAGEATPRTQWGGGKGVKNGKGYCACGTENNCGGLDSSSEQRARRCNCDVADDKMRADAGTIKDKALLPVGQFVHTATSFKKANLTLGPLVCAQKNQTTNECETGFNDCDKNAECVNTDESYRCFCKEGWQGKGSIIDQDAPRANGRECIDDNECSWKPCHFDQTCLNLPGSFNCTCKAGLKQTGPMECEDINECADPKLNDCHKDAECKNTHGSYECRCKSGFRGDGKTECIPVGQCMCFGDPHCISFDNKWLHHQGDCEYTMAQDGCKEGDKQTFRVTVEHWKEQNARPGYYSWTKAVHIVLPTLNFNISLLQDHVVEVNGIAMQQFHDAHRVSVSRILKQLQVKVITGLEVTWDGKDVVEVFVPVGDIGRTCGICGNFNQDNKDDWTIGPACPAKEGQVTDNYDLFGRSWTVTDSKASCKPDCTDTKPNPNITTCTVPMKMVEKECDKLMDISTSPFKECLKLKSAEVLKEIRYSCMMDGCNEEFNLRARICKFSEAIAQHCASYDNVKISDWRSKTDACDDVVCPEGQEYSNCGPTNPKTCLNINANITTIDLNVCADGCFCPEGLVHEGDKCVKPEECGCFYNNEYMAAGEVVVLANCGDEIKCLGKNETKVTPMECKTNEECGKDEKSGKRACVCKDGFLFNEETKKCEVDKCHNVKCELENAECTKANGTCACAKGYIADCGICEDIDECATGQDDCNTLMGKECVNTDGGFVCRCGSGLVPKGDNCEDIDECEYDLKSCGANSQCVNLFGSASCECCAGFSKNSEGNCVPDGTAKASGGKCCHCTGHQCDREGQICGTDGRTYTSYRALVVSGCRENKDDLTIAYPGPCQASCENIVCEKKFSTCEVDADGVPQCACPSCKNVTTFYEEDMVCASNKITYRSVCHLKKDTCEANIETDVEVETVGKPCPPGPGEKPTEPGDWSEWGPCSEQCQQGTRERTRDANGLKVHEKETKPCYATCPNGPCTPTTCEEKPGSVCTVNGTKTLCSCPLCDEPVSPVCARVGFYISTFDSECAMYQAACKEGEKDFEILEKNACEEKPKGCGRIRNFKIYEDEQGCKADREVDMGYCYGGCEEANENNDMCCTGTQHEYKFVILTCPNGSRKNKFVKQVKSCDCIKKSEVNAPKQTNV